MGIAGVLVVAYARIDQVIVFVIAGSRSAGLYGAVYNVLDQSHFVPISILTTLSPVLAASWPADRAKLLRTARLTAELLAIASFGGAGLLRWSPPNRSCGWCSAPNSRTRRLRCPCWRGRSC